jgi:hypothetical protein
MGHYDDQYSAAEREWQSRQNRLLEAAVEQLKGAWISVGQLGSGDERYEQAKLKIKEAILWLNS